MRLSFHKLEPHLSSTFSLKAGSVKSKSSEISNISILLATATDTRSRVQAEWIAKEGVCQRRTPSTTFLTHHSMRRESGTVPNDTGVEMPLLHACTCGNKRCQKLTHSGIHQAGNNRVCLAVCSICSATRIPWQPVVTFYPCNDKQFGPRKSSKTHHLPIEWPALERFNQWFIGMDKEAFKYTQPFDKRLLARCKKCWWINRFELGPVIVCAWPVLECLSYTFV